MSGVYHGNTADTGFNWSDDMVRRGSDALLVALWREHESILLHLRERGLSVRAPGDLAW